MTLVPTLAQPSQAERAFARLSPTAFPELPDNVVRNLQQRGCTIPQTAESKTRENVIRGEFARPGQTDWAALCYCKGFLALYVFWKGSEVDVAVVGRRQFPAALPVAFETAIAPVNRKYISDHHRAYGGPKPPPIDHQGIESGGEKASMFLYYYQSKWLTLQGAD